MSNKNRSFALSHDESNFRCDFPTSNHAYREGVKWGKPFWIGEAISPLPPEAMWHADEWLEYVSVQDEYCCEAADGWDDSSQDQRRELEELIRPILGLWLDRHDLRPKFCSIVNVQAYDAGGNPLEPIGPQATEAMNPGFKWEGK